MAKARRNQSHISSLYSNLIQKQNSKQFILFTENIR